MPRDLTTAMRAAIESETSEIVAFIELGSSDGAVRFTTAAETMTWDTKTWVAAGGHIQLDAASESADAKRQGFNLRLSGVDQSLVAVVLESEMRGRRATIWYAHLADGDVVGDPVVVFEGFTNSPLTITEARKSDGNPGGVSVETRLIGRMSEFDQVRELRTNVHSHRQMLQRAGLSGGDLSDGFFRFVGGLASRRITWGEKVFGYRNDGGGTATGRTAQERP